MNNGTLPAETVAYCKCPFIDADGKLVPGEPCPIHPDGKQPPPWKPMEPHYDCQKDSACYKPNGHPGDCRYRI